MTRKHKSEVIAQLTEKFATCNYFYVVDAEGLSSDHVSAFRRACFNADIDYRVVKNTLLVKSLEQSLAGIDHATLARDVLKGASGVLFSRDIGSAPAKIIQSFRVAHKLDKPYLKGAYVDQELLIGDTHLSYLSKLKSKTELLGELLALLKSPLQRTLNALQSGNDKLMGILRALAHRAE